MHSEKRSHSPGQLDQWKSYSGKVTEILKGTALSTEVLDPTDFRWSSNVYPKETSITSSSSYSSLYTNNTTTATSTPLSIDASAEDLLEILYKKAPKKIPLRMREIKRIKRNKVQRVVLKVNHTVSFMLSLPILLLLLSMAVFQTAKTHILDSYLFRKKRPQDHEEIEVPDEQLIRDETYYANRWGYISEMHEVLTQDGYILTMYRIFKKGSLPHGKRPVLIGHGLFQCSGAFVLNEERSLAFELVENGYDVWVGNNRSIAGFGHISLSYEDPEYWNWGLKELGIYDFSAMIDHVREYSGFSKVGYIGHSQGNAQAFIALSLCPEIGDKLSFFAALAPAVFSGNLVNTFPLRLLINLNDWLYSILFGTTSFLPIMSFAQTIVEPRLFCFLAYSMFSFLFNWWDSHWLRRRKAKYFQFTPRPVSTRLIADWITGWGRKGVCMYIGDQTALRPHTVPKEPTYKVPLVIFYGTADFLVNGEKFVRTFPGYETHGLSPSQLAKENSNHEFNCRNSNSTLFPMLDLVHVERVEGYEHMDTIWGHDNHQTTYPIVLKYLENARWD